MRSAPREVAITKQHAATPPIVATGLHPWETFQGLVVLGSQIEFSGGSVGARLDADAWSELARRLEGWAQRLAEADVKAEEWVIDVFLDRDARVPDLITLIGTVGRSKGRCAGL